MGSGRSSEIQKKNDLQKAFRNELTFEANFECAELKGGVQKCCLGRSHNAFGAEYQLIQKVVELMFSSRFVGYIP